ncbi:Rid family detoxifying hydrolase [Buchnera aphidicola (Taiwanaphis decaspermi)]|uniref:Rid family detoxifying hydrolase n=1 Tax=Buchnera aphidicola TaxID=9 RepID=UPI0031B848F2
MYKIIKTKKSPKPIGPYVQGIDTGNFIFVSGQIPIDENSGNIPENINDQTYQTLLNIKFIIEKAKLTLNNIIKTTIFIVDINDLKQINKTYNNFFKENNSKFPTRSCVEVNKLPKNVKIEIEAIAYRKK